MVQVTVNPFSEAYENGITAENSSQLPRYEMKTYKRFSHIKQNRAKK